MWKIKNWNQTFENNKSRERSSCKWCAIPNKQDGLGYGRLLSLPDGPALYGAFVAVVLVASKHPKPRDGHLTGTGRAQDRPYTADDLSIKTKIPEEIIKRMLAATTSEAIGWIEKIQTETDSCEEGARRVPTECPPSALEENRIEEKGIEGKGDIAPFGASAATKKTTFKNWGKEEFLADIQKSNTDQLLEPDEVEDFAAYWMEKSSTGKTKLSMEKTWDTRRRMQTALRLIFEKRRQRQPTLSEPTEEQKMESLREASRITAHRRANMERIRQEKENADSKP